MEVWKAVCIFFSAKRLVIRVPYLMHIYSSLMMRPELIAGKVLLFSWIFMINSVIVYELVLLLQRPLCVLCRTYGCQHAPALSTEFIMQEAVGLRRHVGYFVFFMFQTHVGRIQSYLCKHALGFYGFSWWQKWSNSCPSKIHQQISERFSRALLLGTVRPGEIVVSHTIMLVRSY